MTLIEKLELALAKHKRQDKVRCSLAQLREYGRASTGESTRRGTKVWTDKIEAILTEYAIPYESGNDAPRGGKNGEYVKLTSPTMLAIIRKERKAAHEDYMRREAERKARYERSKAVAAEVLEGRYDDIVRDSAQKLLSADEFRSSASLIAFRLKIKSTSELRNALYERAKVLMNV